MNPSNKYRDLLFSIDDPRLVEARQADALGHGRVMQTIPFLKPHLDKWEALIDEPFHGLTCDGTCQSGLFQREDEGAPTAEASRAAMKLLEGLNQDQCIRLRFDIDAKQWRMWSNPEFLINDYGLRLDNEDQAIRDLVMRVIDASLGQQGFEKTQGCMRTNDFLGELTQLPLIMNEWSFNFLLFGEPEESKPWGWSIYGHHLCINCVFIDNQMVVSPVFMGAEPNVVDQGKYAGLKLFSVQEEGGLALMQSLSPELKARSCTYQQMGEAGKPEGRWHIMDGLHLGGAFQDNRVVPYEGILATEMNKTQTTQLLDIVEAFYAVLPDAPRARRIEQFERHLDSTYWSWIGQYGSADPFYYRIQSPVIMLEFDHHQGVWLNNTKPAKCHIHTVMRTPNGNDYGKDLLRQHYADCHPGEQPGK